MSEAVSPGTTGRLRARPDLIIVPTGDAAGGAVVKDPLSLEYFRLGEREAFLMDQLRDPRSLSELTERFRRRFPCDAVTADTVLAFCGSLAGSSLLVGGSRDAPRTGMVAKLLAANPIAIRLPGVDPAPLLRRLDGFAAAAFSSAALAVFALLSVVATIACVGAADELVGSLATVTELSRPRYAAFAVLAVVIAKSWHELGHAVACRRMGAECHEAGVLLLAFTPCLYCDASDAWTLPQRWRRVVVALAGVWFEAWLALAAIGVWFFAEPLWLRTLALDVVIVSLVSSLLVNLNPLLRFDGYYVLADTTGIANLHGESRDALWGPIARWVTASPVAEPSRRPRWLVWYGLASMLFGWGVLVVILWSLHGWLASLGWRAAGDALVAVTAAGLISGGIARVAARTPRGPGGRRGVAALRSVLLLVATGATSAAVLAWPIEQSLRSPCRLEAADSTEIVASIAGELHLVAAYGDRVRAGDVLAELREPAAELRESELAQRVTESELRIKTLRTRAERDATLFSDLASARSELAEAGRQLAAHRAEQERRLIVAPRDGVLTGPPAFNPPASDERHSDLPAWTGRPLDPANAGAHLEAGAVLGAIARGKKLRAVVLLDQADSGLVEVTDRVRIALDRSPGEPLLGRVVRVAPAAADRDRLGRSSLDDARDAELRGALGRADPYRVTVELDTSSVGAQPGAVGAARIVTGRETVGESLLRWLRRLFRLG